MSRPALDCHPVHRHWGFMAAVLPLVAAAQTSVTEPLVIQVNGVKDVTIFPETCSLTLPAKWYSQVSQPACDPLKLWATTGECGDAPGTDDVRYTDVPVTLLSAGSGDFSVKVSSLPGFKDAAKPCGGADFELEHKICGSIAVSTGFDCTFTTTRSIVRATWATLTYDALPPATPTLDGVTELDKTLQISFTAGDDVVAVEVWLRPLGETDWFQAADDASATSGSARIGGLTNGVTYEIAIFAVDASGNRSAESNILTGTPKLTYGFWAAYQSGGGGDKGCGGSSATGFGAPLAFLALLALSRRTKR